MSNVNVSGEIIKHKKQLKSPTDGNIHSIVPMTDQTSVSHHTTQAGTKHDTYFNFQYE